MEIAKALILSGDPRDGQRPWPTAPALPRALFPLANRPILLHGVESLRRSGVLEATILVAPGSGDVIERVLGNGRRYGVALTYAAWEPQGGLRGALTAGRSFVGDEPVLVQRADAVLSGRLTQHIATFARDGLDALTLRLAGSGAAPDGHPDPNPGHLLSPRAVTMLAEPGPLLLDGSPMASVRARGGLVRVEDIEGLLPGHGDHESLLAANRAMLERLDDDGVTLDLDGDGTRVQGPVVVHPTASVVRSTLRGPLIVGPHASITDAYIGPYTSIGAGVVLEGAEIEHSIVLPEAQLRFVGARMESCVIGRGARVVRTFERPAALRLTLGDSAEVVLP
jgi:glucose-1-phosphate thymidylyltransferase